MCIGVDMVFHQLTQPATTAFTAPQYIAVQTHHTSKSSSETSSIDAGTALAFLQQIVQLLSMPQEQLVALLPASHLLVV